MAELRDAILADPSIEEVRRRDIASALRCLAKGLHRPLDMISTDPAQLRGLLANTTPAMAGFKSGRWNNIRSLTQQALAHVGVVTVPSHARAELSPAWKALLQPLTTYGDRYKLSRLGRYCTDAGIEPAAVDDAVLAGFRDDLRTASLVSSPDRLHRDAITAWNRGMAASSTWPETSLTVPDNRDTYAIPWTDLPASLKADVDAWVDRLAGTDLMADSDFDPLKPASVQTRRKQIHLFVSALVRQGEDPTSLRTLADVVVPERVAKALAFFRKRAGKKQSVHGGQVVGVVRSIAKHWVQASQEDLDRLKPMARQITAKHTGMSKRNKERLRPLKVQRTLHRLLTLPAVMRDEVLHAGVPAVGLALQLQTAVAIQLLLLVPMRIKNLAALQVGTHILIGRRGDMTLVLDDDEVKNGVPAECGLPRPAAELINLYLSHYRPLLDDTGSNALFPGQAVGGVKSCEGLRHQIKRCIRIRCGLESNPHLFRHLSAMMMLRDNPGAYGQVQAVLGHKKINTTQAFYCGMEVDAAFGHYHDLLGRVTDAAEVPLSKATTKKSPGPNAKPPSPKKPSGPKRPRGDDR
jgi:integrase